MALKILHGVDVGRVSQAFHLQDHLGVELHPEMVLEVECLGDPADVDTVEDLERHRLGAAPPP